MAFDMEGLMDFGSGAFQGGTSGALVGSLFAGKAGAAGAAGAAAGGAAMAPIAIGAGVGALGLGALSYFGGAPQRRLEKKANALSMKSMEQELELGEFKLGEARRQRSMDMDAQKRKETFGRLLSQYFARKQGGV